MKMAILYLLLIILSPILISAFIMSVGGIVSGMVYLWATDYDDTVGAFLIALCGEIGYLFLLLWIFGGIS